VRQPLTGFGSQSGSSPVSTGLPFLAGMVTLSGGDGGRDSSFVGMKAKSGGFGRRDSSFVGMTGWPGG